MNVQHGNANIVEGLALSYSREKPGSCKRVELLSCVAQQYTNKELKQLFRFTNSRGEEVSCTDYELTKARLQSKMYGPGAALPKIRRQYSHKLPPETIAFVLELIHHPDSVEYSSYKTAPNGSRSLAGRAMLKAEKCTTLQVEAGLDNRFKYI